MSGDSYSVVGQATDNAGNIGTSSTTTFTYSTAAPTVTVTYPVNSTTYGTNWTGTIMGTAGSNSGASLSSTVVAVEDTTAAKWWNGTSFRASSQTFVVTGGTPAAWTLALAAGNLTSGHTYTVIGKATDNAGNIGTSSTTTFPSKHRRSDSEHHLPGDLHHLRHQLDRDHHRHGRIERRSGYEHLFHVCSGEEHHHDQVVERHVVRRLQPDLRGRDRDDELDPGPGGEEPGFG